MKVHISHFYKLIDRLAIEYYKNNWWAANY